MPGALPDGEPVPADGSLPDSARGGLGQRPFGIYVHVPFCVTRCGYCDFNTYTAAELGGREGGSAVSPDTYASLAIAEIAFARAALGPADLPVSTVFFGGGTPTLLAPAALGAILRAIDAEFGLAPGAEVTSEANPESVDAGRLGELRAQGVTRMSFGMQSAVPGVLAVLDRVHSARAPGALRRVGPRRRFRARQPRPDLRNPGRVRRGLAALGGGRDRRRARSRVGLRADRGGRDAAGRARPPRRAGRPDDDVLAERYLAADYELAAAGLTWYEISNWATGPPARCAHNVLYWTGGDWWGIGPGAHGHVGGTRWWNVRHPAAYGARIACGVSPGQAREVLTGGEHRLERVMLLTRLAEGARSPSSPAGRDGAAAVVADGLADRAAYEQGRIVLTAAAGCSRTPWPAR